MRGFASALFPLVLAVTAAGFAPAAPSPPRLLGLTVSNGDSPFAGDTARLTTVSPNGDGFRDRAIVRFRLDRPALVKLYAVATGDTSAVPRTIWKTALSLSAGPHRLVWKPKASTPPRTYLLRFVVVGRSGGRRVYGYEPPKRNRPTTGVVIR